MQERHRESVRSARWRGRPEDGGALTTPGPPDDPEKFRDRYGGEPLDDASLAFIVDPVRCVRTRCTTTANRCTGRSPATCPSPTSRRCHDRPVPHALQLEMIGRLPRPATVVELDTGHIPAVTHTGASRPRCSTRSARRSRAGVLPESPTMAGGSFLTISTHLDVSDVPDGLVRLDPGSDRVHYLDPVTTVVFELCRTGCPRQRRRGTRAANLGARPHADRRGGRVRRPVPPRGHPHRFVNAAPARRSDFAARWTGRTTQ